MPSTSLVLTTAQRSDLEARVRSGRGRADAARRARVILLLADGCSYATIAAMTGCSSRTIALWKQRVVKDGLAGLRAASRLEADCADAGPGSAHHDVDAPTAASWRHTLVHAGARPQAGRPAQDCVELVAA
jgi:hypothetical protein